MSDYLGIKKVCARWVPKLQHANRIECCEELLDSDNQDPNEFFCRILTGERDMDTPLRSTQPARTKDLEETRRKDTNPTTSHMIAGQDHNGHLPGIVKVFFSSIFYHVVLEVSGSHYTSLLYQLRSSIREKRRDKFTRGVLVLHHNAPLHKFSITQTAIQYIVFIELNHFAHSPDIAHSDNDHESLFGEC